MAIPIALAGCGSRSDSEQVRSVMHRYLVALANGDGRQACSLLTIEAQQRVLRRLETRSSPGCPGRIRFVHKLLGARQIAHLRTAPVTVVSLSGSKAAVRVINEGHASVFPLSKSTTGWLLDSGSE